MAVYRFKCGECGKRSELSMPMAEMDASKRPSCCNLIMEREYSEVRVHVFKPYVEDRFTGEPIHISSPEQRDKLMKENHVTYDSVNYGINKPASPIDELTLEEVLNEAPKYKDARRPDGVYEGRIGELESSGLQE